MGTGVCRLVGRVVTEVRTPGECNEIGGTWEETGTGTGGTTNDCFVRNILTRSFADTILWLGTTYPTAVAVRDRILSPTEFGKQTLNRYYASLPQLYQIATQDNQLLNECLEAWLISYAFVEQVVSNLDAALDKRAKGKKGREELRFSSLAHEKAVKLIGQFRERSRDPDFLEFMDIIEKELGYYKGVTSSEAIKVFHRSRSRDNDRSSY